VPGIARLGLPEVFTTARVAGTYTRDYQQVTGLPRCYQRPVMAACHPFP